MDQTKPDMGKRIRQPHTRSRAGCRTCRTRRVKCDGNQPSCSRCTKAGRCCDFGTPNLPLRDRRTMPLPGQQAWFVHSNQLRPILWRPSLELNAIDPFGPFAAQLPFKSKELLQYFHQSLYPYEPCSKRKDRNILPLIVQHPDALRNTLLVACLHYAWIVGDTKAFETTFLYHKVETIRLLNKWLESPQAGGLATVIRQIATLSLTECSFGNIAAAETHLDGLMAVMDLYRPIDDALDATIGLDEEIAYRYLILTYHYLHGIKSRIRGSKVLSKMFQRQKVANFPEFMSLIHQWHDQHIGCLEMQLEAIGLIPFFFGALPRDAKVHDIDGSPIIDYLRALTKSICSRYNEEVNMDPRWVWMEGSASRLDLAFVDSHIESIFGTDETPLQGHSSAPKLTTSWTGVTIAAGLYLQSTLDLWNAGDPIEQRLFRRVMAILMRDLERSISELKDPCSSDLWFWKVFVGACSLEKHQLYAHDPMVQVLSDYFDALIRSWSQVSMVTQWMEAERRLLKITWPAVLTQCVAERVWHRAVKLNTGGDCIMW